ncbi:MAG: hypothetical protein ACRDQ5_07790 [Sciscionella sp.]
MDEPADVVNVGSKSSSSWLDLLRDIMGSEEKFSRLLRLLRSLVVSVVVIAAVVAALVVFLHLAQAGILACLAGASCHIGGGKANHVVTIKRLGNALVVVGIVVLMVSGIGVDSSEWLTNLFRYKQ